MRSEEAYRVEQALLKCGTVDPSRLHDMTTRGSNCTEDTQAGAACLRLNWEMFTKKQRTELAEARRAGDVDGIQLAQIALAERDARWRSEMAELMQEAQRRNREQNRSKSEVLREQHDRARRWVKFWTEARVTYIETEQKRWKAARRACIDRGLELQQRGCSEAELEAIDAEMEQIQQWMTEVPYDKKVVKITNHVNKAQAYEQEMRSSYLEACRRLA